jgi:hypothetical protein
VAWGKVKHITTKLIDNELKRKTANNSGFVSGDVMGKRGALCSYLISVLIDSFVLSKLTRTQSPKPL